MLRMFNKIIPITGNVPNKILSVNLGKRAQKFLPEVYKTYVFFLQGHMSSVKCQFPFHYVILFALIIVSFYNEMSIYYR